MKLKVGALALDFTGIDIYDRVVNLSDYKGKRIILSFYRNVACPFCNRRIHQIMGNNVALQNAGVQMFFLFESSNQKLTQSIFHQGISPWPLIGDPSLSIYKKYGVENSIIKSIATIFKSDIKEARQDVKSLNLPSKDSDASANLIPADFFIDESFVVVNSHYGDNIDGHVPLEELKKFAGI